MRHQFTEDPSIRYDFERGVRVLQHHVDVWVNHNFPHRDWGTVAAGTAEEVGELMRCCVKLEQGIRGTREEWLDEMSKEVADVLIKLMDVCSFYGIDFGRAVLDRWDTVSQRDFQADSVGHGMPDDG